MTEEEKKAVAEIDRMAEMLGLPMVGVKETALGLYHRAVKEGLVSGKRSMEGIASAALYIACREHRIPQTLEEIADASKSPLKEVRLSYFLLLRKLGIKLQPVDPRNYVPRLCSRLNLEDSEKSKAIEIIEQATEQGLTIGRKPVGTAVAAIYIAATLAGDRKYRNQEEICSATGVTLGTLRDRYTELLRTLSSDELEKFYRNLHAHKSMVAKRRPHK